MQGQSQRRQAPAGWKARAPGARVQGRGWLGAAWPADPQGDPGGSGVCCPTPGHLPPGLTPAPAVDVPWAPVPPGSTPPAPSHPVAFSHTSGSHGPENWQDESLSPDDASLRAVPVLHTHTLTSHGHTQEWAGGRGTRAVSSQPSWLTKLRAPCSRLPPVLVPVKQHVCVLEQRARMESRRLRPQRLHPGALARSPLSTRRVPHLECPLMLTPPRNTTLRPSNAPAKSPTRRLPPHLPAALCLQGAHQPGHRHQDGGEASVCSGFNQIRWRNRPQVASSTCPARGSPRSEKSRHCPWGSRCPRAQ